MKQRSRPDLAPVVESSHTWLGMFASRLLELRPRGSSIDAMRCAVSSFHEAGGLDPRKAADGYASAYARGKAKQIVVRQEPASSRYAALFRETRT